MALGMNAESLEGKTLDDAAPAIVDVVDLFHNFSEATGPVSAAAYLVDLSNAIAALATWHKDYNYDTGLIEYDEDVF